MGLLSHHLSFTLLEPANVRDRVVAIDVVDRAAYDATEDGILSTGNSTA